MLTSAQVAAAARLGLLCQEGDLAAAADQALHELGVFFPLDAAVLLGRDPVTGELFRLAGRSYSAETTRVMARDFVGSLWYRLALSEALPGSISGEDQFGFRSSAFYAEHVEPNGLRDGMLGVLRNDGRFVGMVQLASGDPDTFDLEARRLLAALLPVLSVLVDPLHRLPELASPSPPTSAVLLAEDGAVIDVAGRECPSVLADPEVRALARDFLAAGRRRLSLLWPEGRQWYRLDLSRKQLPWPASPQAVLVRCRPTVLPYRLTPRELQVLSQITLGRSNQAMAGELGLSQRTVESHVQRVLVKLGAASRAAAAAIAVREGILYPGRGLMPSRGARGRGSSTPRAPAGR